MIKNKKKHDMFGWAQGPQIQFCWPRIRVRYINVVGHEYFYSLLDWIKMT